MNSKELEDRLIDFSVSLIDMVAGLNKPKAGTHLSSQLVTSGTSCALNYGEAQSGESKKDFIHKMKIISKELKETFICLKIIEKSNLYPDLDALENAQKENDELICIFVKSIITAEKNFQNRNIG